VPLDGSPAEGVESIAGIPGGDTEPGGAASGSSPPTCHDLLGRADPARAGQQAPPAAGEPEPASHAATRPAAQSPLAATGPGPARPDLVPWMIAAAVFAPYTAISVFRYLRRDPTSWDLGIFTEYVKQFAHLRAPIVNIRGSGVNLLGDHFHPIVALIAPFFRLFPSPVTLLVAQALLAAVSVVPVCRAGSQLLGTGIGRTVGAAYGFSWGLQQMVNYDFHEIAFAIPLLAFSLSALIRGRMRAAVLWALPLVFVKEDQGFTLVAIGLIIVFSYRRRGLGFFLAGWGLLWSLLAILVIIPHFSATHSYAYWSQAGAISPVGGHFSAGGLWTRLADGASVKLPTLALILLPTAFIALRSPLVLAVLPSLALRFIGTNPFYWGTQWHYNATVMPIVFIAAIDGMARARARHGRPVPVPRDTPALPGRRPQRGAVSVRLSPGWLSYGAARYGAAVMLGVSAALAFQFPLSSLWTPATYSLGPHVSAANAAIALVPDGASVATDLDLLAPLAPRTNTYWLGNYATNPATQYVVFDVQSTDWQPAPPANALSYVEFLTHKTKYQQIYVNNGVYVFRRAS
jgi:uncharacterized membrane protein